MSLKYVVLLAGFLAPALADAATSQAFNPTPTRVDPLVNPPFTLGFEFQVNSAYTVSKIGIFDSGSDGLLDSYDVGLFDSSGTLISSATVPNGTGGSLIDGFRYVSIAPTSLLAGQNYYVGAVYLAGDDPVVFTGTVTSDPALTYLGGRFAFGSTLEAPTITGLDGGYFGPNIAGMSNVPIPASAPMFGAALIALGIAGYATKRKKAAAIA